MAGKEIATVDPERYSVLSMEDAADGLGIQEIIADNFGDDGISPYDLDRISVPAGGGTTWEIPTIAGDESRKILEGVVVAWTKPRVFWEVSLDDSDEQTPPDCSSDDGVLGQGMYGPNSEGNPSGQCSACPMNEWGSAGEGRRGKGCKETRLLFMLLEDGLLPVTVSLPPTSIAPLRKYFLRLASSRVPYYAVSTRLELEKVKGSGAIQYAVVKPSLGARLPQELAAQARTYGETFTSMQTAGAARVAADEYQKGADGE